MGWGDAHIVVGNSKSKTFLPSSDQNFPTGSEQVRLGSRTWVSASDTMSSRAMRPWKWDPQSSVLTGETEAQKEDRS